MKIRQQGIPKSRLTRDFFVLQPPLTGSAWAGILPQGGTRKWIAIAGVNVDDDTGNVLEHTEASDDCRTHNTTPAYVSPYNTNFYAHAVNLAEILYNEARGEKVGAIDMVGWTVRDRAFMGVNNNVNNDRLTCDSYPGGVGWHSSCSPQPCQPCSTLPCNQNHPQDWCTNNLTRWYCCAMHGGQTQLGTSGYQFNDEHVNPDTLFWNGYLDEAVDIMSNYIPEPSTGYIPDGAYNCVIKCDSTVNGSGACYPNGPGCCRIPQPDLLTAFTKAAPFGPVEFRNCTYTPLASSCKTLKGYVCGNSPTNCRYTCGTTPPSNCSFDNYFWNRAG